MQKEHGSFGSTSAHPVPYMQSILGLNGTCASTSIKRLASNQEISSCHTGGELYFKKMDRHHEEYQWSNKILKLSSK